MDDEKFIEKGPAELRMLYQITIDDIKYAKRLQWTTTYYILLTFAAIIGFYFWIKPLNSDLGWDQKIWLLLPALGINILAVYHLMDTQKCQAIYRMRIIAIKERLEKITKDVLDISIKNERDEGKYYGFDYYFLSLVLPFIILITVGLLYVAWSLSYYSDDELCRLLLIFFLVLVNVLCCLILYRKNKALTEDTKETLDKTIKKKYNSRK